VNHQIRPWIFTRRPTSSLNYAKYQLSPWICQTPIKKVHPSKCSVSHADLSPCMLCCLVHVARRKPRVQGLIWLNWKKLSFNLSVYFFSSAFLILPLHYPYLLLHISKHKKRPWPFFFPLKLSPFSPLQNHHHLRRFWRFWSLCVQRWLKVTPFLLFIKFMCSYSPCFCPFFLCVFVLSFDHVVYFVSVIVDARLVLCLCLLRFWDSCFDYSF